MVANMPFKIFNWRRYATVTCELDMEQVAVRRRNMPLEKQRRGDLYALHDMRHRGMTGGGGGGGGGD